MKIAIIGAGQLSGALGKGWAKAGHSINFGVRDPGHEKTHLPLAEVGGEGSLRTVGQAVFMADIVVLAAAWKEVRPIIGEMGDVNGKILIDCTNPVTLNSEGGLGLEFGSDYSGAEEVARLASGARVAKAFNTYGWEVFADPSFPGNGAAKPTLFHCSDEDEAKEIVAKLAQDLGFEPVDVGGLGMARTLEPMALFWIRFAFNRGRNPNFALAMLKR